MDKKVEVEQAKAFLQGRRLDDTDNAVLISRHVTHFEVDFVGDCKLIYIYVCVWQRCPLLFPLANADGASL